MLSPNYQMSACQQVKTMSVNIVNTVPACLTKAYWHYHCDDVSMMMLAFVLKHGTCIWTLHLNVATLCCDLFLVFLSKGWFDLFLFCRSNQTFWGSTWPTYFTVKIIKRSINFASAHIIRTTLDWRCPFYILIQKWWLISGSSCWYQGLLSNLSGKVALN